MTIREMDISARSKSCLLNAGYTTIDELENITDDELLEIRNLNHIGFLEIRNALKSYFGNVKLSDEEVYSKFLRYLANGEIDEGFLYLEKAVNNGYSKDYSIIPSYYMLGFKGHGGNDWENALIWTRRFVDDYNKGLIVFDDDSDIDISVHEFNLGILNLRFLDSIGNIDEAKKYLQKFIDDVESLDGEHEQDLAQIAVGMLGANLNFHGYTIDVEPEMQLAVNAFLKAAELGDEKAKQIISHVDRDGFDIKDVDRLLIELNNNENGYLFALCFRYGYLLSVNEDESAKLLREVFGEGFDYEEYNSKHILESSEDDDNDFQNDGEDNSVKNVNTFFNVYRQIDEESKKNLF